MFNQKDVPIFMKSIMDVNPVSMCEGITRKTLSTGKKIMLCLFEWDANAILPEHSHEHEQAGYVISGKVEFNIDGKKYLLGSGESYVIPGHVKHSGKSHEPTKVLDAFSPIRSEYL